MLHPDDQTATIHAIATGLAAGDPVADAVLDTTAGYLGVGVAHLVNLLNPEVIVLSSWVAAALGQPLLTRVCAVAARHALRRPLGAAEITLGRIPGNPVSLGAATFALERFLAGIGSAAGEVQGRRITANPPGGTRTPV